MAVSGGPDGATAPATDPRERGIGELVKDLASQTSTLVRQEIQLAQAEVTQKGQLDLLPDERRGLRRQVLDELTDATLARVARRRDRAVGSSGDGHG